MLQLGLLKLCLLGFNLLLVLNLLLVALLFSLLAHLLVAVLHLHPCGLGLLLGREVQTSDGAQGRCLGVSANGSLRLQSGEQEITVNSSEVSVRPRV